MGTIKEASRKEWNCAGQAATHQELQTGCLQRITDATELMARSYREIIEDRDRYERWYEEKFARVVELSRTCSALRGVITKLKRRS